MAYSYRYLRGVLKIGIFHYSRFNTELRVWESISPSPIAGYAEYIIAESNGTIYFQQLVKYSLLRYNTNEDKWSETSEIIPDVEDKRYHMNAIQTIFKAKTSIYVITAQECLYKYNAGLDTWTKVKYLEAKFYQNSQSEFTRVFRILFFRLVEIQCAEYQILLDHQIFRNNLWIYIKRIWNSYTGR